MCAALICGAVLIGGVVAAVQLSILPLGGNGGGEDERTAQPSSLVSEWSGQAKAEALRQHEEEVRAASRTASRAARSCRLLAAAEAAESKAEAARRPSHSISLATATAVSLKAEQDAKELAGGAKHAEEAAPRGAGRHRGAGQGRRSDRAAAAVAKPQPAEAAAIAVARAAARTAAAAAAHAPTLEYRLPYTSADTSSTPALCVQQGASLRASGRSTT